MVGSALLKKLTERGYSNIVLKTRNELDLTNQSNVHAFFQNEKPELVFLASGKTGGVRANIDYPGSHIFGNLMISANVINEAFLVGTQKLFYYGCSSMYPKNCLQPMKEEYILSGPLEETSAANSVGKIAGMMLCDSYNRQYGTSFTTLIPTNMYGENHDYDPMNSIVVPSLIQRFHLAKNKNEKSLRVWGSGKAMRDFLYSGDLADATIFLAENFLDADVFNIGTGIETSIEELARLIAKIVGFKGEIIFDTNEPEGVSRKLQNNEKISKLGWKPEVDLETGLTLTYKDYLSRE